MHTTQAQYVPQTTGLNLLEKVWLNLSDMGIEFTKAQYASTLDVNNEKDREKLLSLYADGLFTSRSEDLA